MVTSPALIKGNATHLLEFDKSEHPVAIQLGGSDPIELAKAAVIGSKYGYDEINLNVGCPSDRVQSGTFGAVLMKTPEVVAKCCKEMIDAVDTEVTVKCRVGVDQQNPDVTLPKFLEHISNAGVTRVIIHARKAWLSGLRPKDNREIPPLNYQRVYKLKETFPELNIIINGGIKTIKESIKHLNYVDGVTSNIQTQIDAKCATGANVNTLVGTTSAQTVPVDGNGDDNYLFLVVNKANGALTAVDKTFLEAE